MFKWIINKFKTFLLIPLIGIIFFIAFFYGYLNPDQRNYIFKEILASMPIAKNFVNINYKTHLSVTGVKDVKELKTAFFSIDYLSSMQNAQGQRYIAVYPFEIEAGFNLEACKTTTLNEKKGGMTILNIELPAPDITTVDLDEKKQVLVVRDDMQKADYDYVLRPVKIAFETKARDYAVRNGIFDKAMENAIKYYRDLWKDTYDEINVSFQNHTRKRFSEYKLPNLPVKFTAFADAFDYRFSAPDSFEWYDGQFENDNSKIWVGYSNHYTESFKNLWDAVSRNASKKVVLKFIDPASNAEQGVICAYDQQGGVCYAQRKGRLFYILYAPTDAEIAKRTLADLFYLSFNIQFDTQRPKEIQYTSFIDLLALARNQVENKNFGQLKNTARSILEIQKDNHYGKLMLAAANTLNSMAYDGNTDFEDINLLLKMYALIGQDGYSDIDNNFIKDVFTYFEDPKYANFLNDFRSLLILNKEKAGLSNQDVQRHFNALVQSGHLTYELMRDIPLNLWTNALKKKMEHIGNQLQSEKRSEGNFLFCSYDGYKYDWRECSVPIYYDLEAIEHIYKKGKNTIEARIRSLFDNKSLEGKPEEHLAVVLTHSGIIFNDYDAFIFKKNSLILHKEIMEGFDNKNVVQVYYSNINPGIGILQLADENYRNMTLLRLLSELHDISKKSSEGTKARVLEFLRDDIVQSVYLAAWAPTI